MAKKKTRKERREENRIRLSSNGGISGNSIALSPVMQKRLKENRTIFSNEAVLKNYEVAQLQKDEQELSYLKIENITLNKGGDEEVKKVNEELIWNKILKEKIKSQEDYELIAQELAKKHLKKNETFLDVDFSTYAKKS